MVVLNAVLYKDDGRFIGSLCDFDQVADGKNRKAVIADLENVFKAHIDFARAHPDVTLLSGIGGEGEKYWERAIKERMKPSEIRQVDGYTLHVYDFTKKSKKS